MACTKCGTGVDTCNCRKLNTSPTNDSHVCNDMEDIVDEYESQWACDVAEFPVCTPQDVLGILSTIIANSACVDTNLVSWICALLTRIKDLEMEVDELNNRVKALEDNQKCLLHAMHTIVDSLNASGAITSNDICNFAFKPNMGIASGNINLFGGAADGTHWIRTNGGSSENDLSAKI